MISYRCPICKEQLNIEKDVRCANGHTFDLAKEGYVNLLLPNQKKKNDPGDNKEMVLAREDFLSKGYFDELVSFVKTKVNGKRILDVGCGTGYYTRSFEGEKFGIDISKHAVRLASKKDKHTHYAVASAFSLPFEDDSFDVLINIFAPKATSEYKRVLKEKGTIVEVVPGKDHMLELKEKLYQNVYKNEEKAGMEGFSLLSSENVTYKREVSDLMSLLAMTPYRYKTSEEAIAKLKEIPSLAVTFDFVVRVWL